MFYLASSLPYPGTEKNKDTLRTEHIAAKLERLGVKVYLPQRDTDQTLTPRKIFSKNLEAIRSSSGIILVMTDSRGIYLEAGYAKALGKKVIGLKVEETRKLGTIVRNFLDAITSSVDEAAAAAKDIADEKKE